MMYGHDLDPADHEGNECQTGKWNGQTPAADVLGAFPGPIDPLGMIRLLVGHLVNRSAQTITDFPNGTDQGSIGISQCLSKLGDGLRQRLFIRLIARPDFLHEGVAVNGGVCVGGQVLEQLHDLGFEVAFASVAGHAIQPWIDVDTVQDKWAGSRHGIDAGSVHAGFKKRFRNVFVRLTALLRSYCCHRFCHDSSTQRHSTMTAFNPFSLKAFLPAAALLLLTMASSAQPAHRSPDTGTIKADLTEFQGDFEGREFQVDNDVLTYYREGMAQAIQLELIGKDHFEIMIPPGAVVQTADGHAIPTFRFNRDDAGVVTSLEIVQPDGSVSATHPKTGEMHSKQDEARIN